MLMTALNLLPVGQLDGGHVVYAVFGPNGHKIISIGMVVLLAAMGFRYPPWWLWALVWAFLGRRHPLIFDEHQPGTGRRWLAMATLVIFIGCVSLVPTRFWS
jgi:membrane-associated protease RseP (regulator of RpoE activity)